MTEATDLFAFENLWRQYRLCRRNKRNTINQLRFELDAEAQLLTLQQELRAHTYQPGQSICFVTDVPKPREVFAADFRDRIVHHVLVSQQEPVFEPRFIHDSYACRTGKGVLAASNRLMQFLRRVTANGQRPAWTLKLDVASFFSSIHKQTLCGIIARHVGDPEVLWLTSTVLFHDPTADYRFKSGPRHTPPPGSGRYPVPEQKSLFGTGNERGLPIGNLTSQFWANVYLALWARHGWLRAFFAQRQHDPWDVRARWPERRLGGPRFASQYRRFIRHAGHDALVFCQVGRFVEFYGPQRLLAARALHLARVGIARGGFAFSVGLPVRLSGAYIVRAVRAGFTVAEVREVDRLSRTCAARQVVAVWIPARRRGVEPLDPGQVLSQASGLWNLEAYSDLTGSGPWK